MPVYIALLRAVNVGGTGKLPMEKLKPLCIDAGFANVRTISPAASRLLVGVRLGPKADGHIFTVTGINNYSFYCSI
jgi:hypothetical protein